MAAEVGVKTLKKKAHAILLVLLVVVNRAMMAVRQDARKAIKKGNRLMDTYILNPSYLLRQDGSRVIICYQERINDKGEEWFSFIHPFHAQMLSFFNGLHTFESELKDCATYFGLSYDKMEKIIKPLMENRKEVCVRQKNGREIWFPKNILLKSDIIHSGTPAYCPHDFTYKGEPDFDSLRLTYPCYLNIELNMSCLTDCIYCYADKEKFKGQFLSTQEILDFIDQAHSNGVLQIDINGGEVLIHPGIKEILKRLTLYGYRPLISTKIPIKESTADFLMSIGIDTIQISLDSSNEEILCKILKVRKTYLAQMEKTLTYLCKIGMHVNINVVLTRFNSSIKEIDNLFLFLHKFSSISTIRINPCGFSLYKKNFRSLSINAKDLESIKLHVEKIKIKYPEIRINFSGYDAEYMYKSPYKEEGFHQRAICTGNLRNIILLPNGNVTICEELYNNPNFIIGNIKKNSLREIWMSEKALKLYNFENRIKTNSPCYSCVDQKTCRTGRGVCWKTVLMAYGNEHWDYPDPRCPRAPFPYNCFYAK